MRNSIYKLVARSLGYYAREGLMWVKHGTFLELTDLVHHRE